MFKSITLMSPEDLPTNIPTPRQAVRAIILSPLGNVLLIQGRDSLKTGIAYENKWWFTPGGGISGSESDVDALQREVNEETGFHIDHFSATPFERTSSFVFEEKIYFQHEKFYIAYHNQQTPDPALLTEIETRTFISYRWWTLHDLFITNETIYPPRLAEWISKLTS